MRVLYVTGACLTKNTSANMSHNGYVQGLLENGFDVDIVMADDSWGEQDAVLKKWDGANYYEYDAVSVKDRIRKKGRQTITLSQSDSLESNEKQKTGRTLKSTARQALKKLFYILFPNDPVYPLNAKWLKTASRYSCDQKYDYVISNSSPAASHKLVGILLKKKRIQTAKWIQIWEDPWFYDLYGGHTEAEKNEEHDLLKQADVICYVSPLTLMYQKKYFSDCAEKMQFIPLPAFRFSDDTAENHENPVFGYFGDYYSTTRNLLPFYQAAKKTKTRAYIIGDSDLRLKADELVDVKPRMTLEKLAEYQNKTDVLVHLCNLKGGQIPGKIYHYSVTDRRILFILDGTEEEKEYILNYFAKYDRYDFCDNDEAEIISTLNRMKADLRSVQPVADFYPVNIVRKLIEKNR